MGKPTQVAANVAVNAINAIGRGWNGAKGAMAHELVQSAKPIGTAIKSTLGSGNFVTQAAAYGVVGGATGYALSDDPKKGIKNGVALGVLGAAGHSLWKSPSLRGALSNYGNTLEKYGTEAAKSAEAQLVAAANPTRGANGRLLKGNPGARKMQEAAARRRAANVSFSGPSLPPVLSPTASAVSGAAASVAQVPQAAIGSNTTDIANRMFSPHTVGGGTATLSYAADSRLPTAYSKNGPRSVFNPAAPAVTRGAFGNAKIGAGVFGR